MSSYITKEDLLDELGEELLVQLTDDSGDEQVNDSVVEKAISYAEGIFDSYVRTRYSLPVPATQMVKSSCLNLAIYQLHRKRATFTDDGVFKVKKTAYDETMSILKDIQKGHAALDVPAAEETIESPATSDNILTNAGRSKFNDRNLSSY